MSRYLVLLFLLLNLNIAHSQDPAPRASGHLIYFKPTKSLLLLDGYESGIKPSSGKAELWEWKDQNWKKIGSTDQPLRSLSAATYMSDAGSLFVYGGIGNSGYNDSLRDAFVYNGKQWKTIEDRSIGTHDHHEMAYDEANKMIVVYGGQTGNRNFDLRTWVFKDNHWKSLGIASPGPRVHHAMAYDAERKKIVLYGGYGDKTNYHDTWEFDGSTWTKIETGTDPGARGHHAMVYDPVSKRVLLYGGDTETSAKGDIWSWDGKKWEQLSDNGPQRILPAISFDPDKNKLYVFGGNGGQGFLFVYSDLWEWDGKKWTKIYNGEVYKFDMEKNKFMKSQE